MGGLSKYFITAFSTGCIMLSPAFVNAPCFFAGKYVLYAQDDGFEDDAAEGEGPELFSLSGMVESENYINTWTGQNLSDCNKKNEIRGRFKIRFGTDEIHLNTTADIYFLPTFISGDLYSDYRYSAGNNVSRNLRLSAEYSEISFNELYFNYSSDSLRLRLGNQIYAWGTADVFNPTSYFNPMDMRELLFKSDDELKYGVPSLSGLVFMGNNALELVFVPLHVPGSLAASGNFWAMDLEDRLYSVRFAENPGMEIDWRNFAYGARYSASVSGFDFSFSAFHGPDRDFVARPAEVKLPADSKPVIEVRPQNYTVSSFGFDFTTTVDKFAFQAEAAYSPDKTGLIEQDTSSISSTGDLVLPFQTKRAHYISYGAGLNYFIPLNRLIEGHSGDTVAVLEWSQSLYFDSEISSPLLYGIIAARLQDSFLDGRLKIQITDLYDVMKGGNVLWPLAGWDFQNGLQVELSYANIHGVRNTAGFSTENSVFYYLKDNDIFIWRLSYEY